MISSTPAAATLSERPRTRRCAARRAAHQGLGRLPPPQRASGQRHRPHQPSPAARLAAGRATRRPAVLRGGRPACWCHRSARGACCRGPATTGDRWVGNRSRPSRTLPAAKAVSWSSSNSRRPAALAWRDDDSALPKPTYECSFIDRIDACDPARRVTDAVNGQLISIVRPDRAIARRSWISSTSWILWPERGSQSWIYPDLRNDIL
jgi:hypothetical protein